MRGVGTEQGQEAGVGEEDSIAMHEDGFVHGLHQALKQLFAILQPRASLFEVFEQFVDDGTELAKGRLVAVAGFQGADARGDITTLGRGGSDLSAVSLAGALKASRQPRKL